MSTVVILGAGMVGSTMAIDLASEADVDVTICDRSQAALDAVSNRVRALCSRAITTQVADLSDASAIARVAASADVVMGALPSVLGLNALRAVIESQTPYVDISFMPEDALTLDAFAQQYSVPAIVDCGVAPGLSNLLAAASSHEFDECHSIDIFVGGLPRERRVPFEYKAAFAPYDVIEEYTRPARLVEHCRIVTREALSEAEMLEFDGDFFPGVGTLEAFNTDGLRSLIETLHGVPFMREKTMRYPGHAQLMKAFRATGLFSHDEVDVRGQRVRPIDLTSALLFPKWTYEEGEADITVMRIIVDGSKAGARHQTIWELFDVMDTASGCSSMSRTTAFPATFMARELLAGNIQQKGVLPPEKLGKDDDLVDRMLEALRERSVSIRRIDRAL
ncbi:MAG: saccharopine dehydrogenase family protein [Phycisphaerales bacterium]